MVNLRVIMLLLAAVAISAGGAVFAGHFSKAHAGACDYEHYYAGCPH